MYLEPFGSLPLTFKFPLPLFSLQWSQNDVLSEEEVVTTYFVPLPELFRLLFAFKFPSPPLILLPSQNLILPEEVGHNKPRASP